MRLTITQGLCLAFLLLACGGSGQTAPPEILLGADTCDFCRMVISEERHAAAARIDAREARFDDPGCLRAWASRNEPDPAGLWVHDESGAWLPASGAWFVRTPAVVTPMASGILAFASPAEAEAVAARHETEVVRWQNL